MVLLEFFIKDFLIKLVELLLSWPSVTLIVLFYLARKIRESPSSVENIFKKIKTVRISEFELRLQEKVEEQEDKINQQQEMIKTEQKKINTVIKYSMADYIYQHLKAIYEGKKNNTVYRFHKNEEMKRDLRFLRDHGFLEFFEIRPLNDGQDLVSVTQPTPVGDICVELREKRCKAP